MQNTILSTYFFKVNKRIKNETYYTNESGCFQPFLKVDFGTTIDKIE
ncbi:hypothetical protein SPONN_1245 [uncultured Candidatus Thioglobus sp.]|nr:hypothetical protein SPONN_1245 [uncultured Candidatus Thioglobus sp.]